MNKSVTDCCNKKNFIKSLDRLDRRKGILISIPLFSLLQLLYLLSGVIGLVESLPEKKINFN